MNKSTKKNILIENLHTNHLQNCHNIADSVNKPEKGYELFLNRLQLLTRSSWSGGCGSWGGNNCGGNCKNRLVNKQAYVLLLHV